jgi:hypothetical protein
VSDDSSFTTGSDLLVDGGYNTGRGKGLPPSRPTYRATLTDFLSEHTREQLLFDRPANQ